MLKNEMIRQGDILFRFRSYIPLILIPLVIAAFADQSFIKESKIVTELWTLISIVISFIGLAIRIITVGFVSADTSGRNTKGQVAGSLNTSGIYSLVRHPIYLGNFVITLGCFIFLENWWLLASVCLLFFIYYERIMLAEEFFLESKFQGAYRSWAEKTPLLVLDFSLWKAPVRSFCLKTVIRREYHSLFGIISAFFLLHMVKNYFNNRGIIPETGWTIFFLAGLVVYLLVRLLAKKTRFLNLS